MLFSPDSALNKRILATLTPGSDDDVVGFVLGFEPGDAAIGSSADYLLLDWKGASQDFDFADGDLINFHHDQTGTGNMPVGLALSRVTGSPTADEFWQHADLVENATGGVAQLARGATLGSAAYNRTGGSHFFDITYTSTSIKVSVDGVEQFNAMGSFPDGRFGLYSAWQGPTATFSDVEIFPAGFAGLSAQVDRTTGNITLRNTGTEPVQFDFYELDSASGSLSTAELEQPQRSELPTRRRRHRPDLGRSRRFQCLQDRRGVFAVDVHAERCRHRQLGQRLQQRDQRRGSRADLSAAFRIHP